MSETSNIRNERIGEELPKENLINFLKDNHLINDSTNAIEVKQFSNGFSNLTYLIEADKKSFVLRRPPFGAIKRGHDMSREYKVLSRLHKIFPKAPKALIYSEDPQVMESSFYIMEKKEGIILNLKEAKRLGVDVDGFKKISDKWLDTFVELHAVDYASVGLSDLGKPEGYVNRQVSNWSKQYVKAKTSEVPQAYKVMEWMEANQPTEYKHSLIHNDFKYDNMAFENESWDNVSAVLDWEMCTLGDPLMDLGTSIAYWTTESDGPMIKAGIPSPTILPGNPNRTDIVEAYALKSGRSIDHLVFYYVFGLFKIAVIAQQIFYRYNQGLTKDPRFAKLDQASALLCVMALQSIQKNRIDDLM